MVTIETGRLQSQVDELNKEALHYNRLFVGMEECIFWVKRQEFNEVSEIVQSLTRQLEELRGQKKELLMLSEVLRRTCDRYDKAEQEILESAESHTKLEGCVKTMKLEELRWRFVNLGLHFVLR